MSKVAVKGNDSGTGVFTLEAPATNTDRTLTIPDSDGELLYTDSNGDFSVDGDTFYVDSANNRVGIGTSSPEALLDIREQANKAALVRLYGARTTNGNNAFFTGFTSRGSVASPATLEADDVIATFSANGHDGTDYQSGGRVRFAVDSISTGSLNSRIEFLTNNGTSDTEQMRLDSSGNLKFNSGYGSVATAYGCRAWVNFDGTGTVSIRGSGNVSSITDNGTGDYTVNFSTAMPDNDYADLITLSDVNSNTQSLRKTNYAPQTGSRRFETFTGAGQADQETVAFAVFR